MAEDTWSHADFRVYGDESGLTFYGIYAGLSVHGLGFRVPGRPDGDASGNRAIGGGSRRGAGLSEVSGISGMRRLPVTVACGRSDNVPQAVSMLF